MIDEENERQIQASLREYLEFLDDEENQGVYHTKVKEMIDSNEARVIVNMNDLRKSKPERADALLSRATIEQLAFQKALNQYANSLNPSLNDAEYFVGFEGSFGYRHVTPRSVRANFINNMICLEGIVTQCSLTKPKLVKSVHYCPATGKTLERKYADLTSLESTVTSSVYPTQDAEGNLLETEFGLSHYKDHQTLTIQEMPERAPAGQLPRSVTVICDHDLTDKCKPGDRVQIVGIYLCLPSKKNSFTNAVFKTSLLANHVTHLSKELKVSMSRNDISNCRKMAKKNNIFELLSKSLAPSIHGHSYVKKAILCMLLGGVEKYLPSGTRIRGDINVLLIGDPSVAKSQLLRYVLCTAPRAIATTGRGSSGVGLTAAITHDKETGERKLEAGAMVLADRGIVCIDEFDKMSDIDRTAIHEVMEQGRVTITKAGINARLNARCSVLAAANPIYGRYDRYRPPMENIGLQDSLLSRFDLIFVMLDEIESKTDEKISDHVLRMHQYRNPSETDGAVLPMGAGVEFLTTSNLKDTQTDTGPVSMFEKYDPLLHGNLRSKTDRIFTVRFMQMYLQFAKSLKPVLSDEACAAITEEFVRLRSEDSIETGFARTQPVTVRTLETLIRLATAHAKARLSCEIVLEDAKAAIELVQFAYFKKVVDKQKKRRRNSDSEMEEDEEAEDNGVEEDNGVVEENGAENGNGNPDDPFEYHSQEQDRHDRPLRTNGHTETERATGSDEPMETSEEPMTITDPRLNIFKQRLLELFQEANKSFLNYRDVIVAFETDGFTSSEINAAITNMTAENQIMQTSDRIFLI